MPLSTPNVTQAQIVGYLTALLSACVILFKLDLTDAQMGAAIALIGAGVPIAHMIADAVIRRGRATVAAAQAISGNKPAPLETDANPAAPGAGGA